MVKDRQVEVALICREIIRRHPTGQQLAEIRPISCNEVIQRLEADEFIFIEVGSAGIRLGEITARIPVTVKKFGIVENQPRLSPGTCGATTPRGIETIVDFKCWLLPIHDFHDPPLRRADRIKLAVRKGQRPRVALDGHRDHTLILADCGEAKDMPGVRIDRIDPTARRIEHDIVRPLQSNAGNGFGLGGDRFTGEIGEGDNAMILRVVGVV